MKKIILPLLLLFVVLTSCAGGDDGGSSCGNISGFTAVQQNEKININLTSTATPLYYEVSVNQMPQTNVNPSNGTIRTMNTTSQSFNLNDINMLPGYTYLFYVRTACTDGSLSKWSAPVSVTATSFCYVPVDLGMTSNGLDAAFKWTTSDSNTSYFQVEYGPQGFTPGSGTTVQVNSSLYSDMTMLAGQTYDFYVRAYCTAALGWSSWAGPYTYLSVGNQNACTIPLNLAYSIDAYSGAIAHVVLQWNWNGEEHFEYAVVHHGDPIGASDIYTADTSGWPTRWLNHSYDWDFYVRAVCNDGSRTPWTAPIVMYL